MAANLPLLPLFFEKFIQNWADKRQPRASQQVKIERHRLYILPTRHGVAYFIMIFPVLFGAINYENSLAFMLAFTLGSLGLLGMVYTHQNINRLSVSIGRAESVFSGQHILLPLSIMQTAEGFHPNIKLQSESGEITGVHLIKQSSAECKLPLMSSQRGYVSAGRIKLFSEYPLGLFHAWSWLNLQAHCLVYPAPDPHHYPLHSNAVNQAQGKNTSKQYGTDEFSGIREYRPGDMANHMAWKAIAKTGELQTKLFNNDASEEISINWRQTAESLDIEQRLSILCRMVLDADAQSIQYALNIPGTIISAASGLQHRHNCLKALALFGK